MKNPVGLLVTLMFSAIRSFMKQRKSATTRANTRALNYSAVRRKRVFKFPIRISSIVLALAGLAGAAVISPSSAAPILNTTDFIGARTGHIFPAYHRAIWVKSLCSTA
jgi:hypothetical protein